MASLARDAREQHPGAAVIKRTRNSIHLALDSTTRIAYIGSNTDYHLPDEQTEIDTAWIAESVDGFQWGMTLAEYHARARSVFNAGSLVRFTHPASGHWVIFDPQSLNWRDVNNSQAQIAIKQNVTATAGEGIDDDLLTWSAGYGPGRHLTYRCVPQRLEKNIVIDTATDLPAPPAYMTAPIWFEAEFTLDHSAGLDLYLDGVLWTKVNNERITTANAIEFREGAVTLFRMARPFARDSAGGEADCQYEVRNQGGIYFVTVRVPQAWLAAAVYPVFIDPTLEATSSANDGYIYGSGGIYATARGASTSYITNSVQLIVGQTYVATTHYVYRGFLLFDTSSLTGAGVFQVNLELTSTDDYSTVDFDVQIVKQDWSAQNPISTDNRETAYDNCLSGMADDSIWRNTSGISVNTAYTSGDLSQTWINKTGYTYYSLRSSRDLSGQPASGNEYVIFASASHATASYRPTLIILYSLGQRAYPDADVSDGSWTPSTGSDLYTVIDEADPSDADYIQSATNPTNDTCVIGLSNVTDPNVHTDHMVYYRYRKDTVAQTINLTVRLKQGSTTIGSNTHNGITTTWTTGSFTLLETEADDISDYSNLRLEFEADVP